MGEANLPSELCNVLRSAGKLSERVNILKTSDYGVIHVDFNPN